MYLIALAFVAVAFLYASVGFGGGSTYTAILIESGLHWELVPPVGGYLQLDESVFLKLLGVALLIAGVLMLLDRQWRGGGEVAPRTGVSLVLGLGLGGLAGLTGIGGGIYLAPVLHLFRLAEARTVAATCSLFILVNSLAGLAGQLTKLGSNAAVLLDAGYLVLPLAVLVGGQLGSQAGARWLPATPIRRLTGLVITIVAVRLLWFS
jgi:uncharacterized membrane protein YfcA